jgi:hypothetical protein
MTVAEWLAYAKADAEKRGIKELAPALEGLAKATEQLRRADWNEGPLSTRSPASVDADDLAQGKRR